MIILRMNLIDLKGVGPAALIKLEKLGVTSIEKLLYHFPTRYIDRKRQLKIIDLKLIDNDFYHCVGKIEKIKKLFFLVVMMRHNCSK